jgi:formylglycine-generating enzyme required for sulfatase activity
LAVGKYPITRAEFAAFLADSHYDITSTVCNVLGVGPGGTWDNPGFPQTENDPVTCMSYDNAMAYAAWLSQKTGHTYRLLSESEWEYAARAGTTTTFYWGNEVGTGHANCPGCGSRWDSKSTSPVGSFAPNPFGLYDMSGNAWEIVGDCWNYSYVGAPSDGSAWRAGNCGNSLERGGNFSQSATGANPAHRGGRADLKDRGLNIHGFRIARTF